MASKYPLVIDAGQVRQAAVGDVILCPSVIDSTLTNGRVVLAGASGVLTDSANFTFDGTIVSVPSLSINTSGQNLAIRNNYAGSASGSNIWIGNGGVSSTGTVASRDQEMFLLEEVH